MTPIFNAEDFSQFLEDSIDIRRAANIANAKLEKLLGPEVFGQKYADGKFAYDEDQLSTDTHRARIFNIQPIETKCEHTLEPFEFISSKGLFSSCTKCGAKLKAKWEVAGE